mmetsp:Transcript_6245/g.12916  ORF Transcript_6245/g.12916 Transcript_6245/m.12916 type:complete len:426 (-) Transcript_6245:105-1382(-)
MAVEDDDASSYCSRKETFEKFHQLVDDLGERRGERRRYTNRLDWEDHVEGLRTQRKGFQQRYHMSEDSFNKLVDLLRPIIAKDEKQSMRSTQGVPPITPEMTVGAGLRYLGGDLIYSIGDSFNCSESAIQREVDRFLQAVDEKLEIRVPESPAELKKAADDWNDLSGASDVYYGMMGAIDGWLCCTNKPAVNEVDSVTDYFSGHYMRFGLNVQAICDANLRFIYFGVAAPGRTNDNKGFRRCEKLCRWMDTLPEGHFLIGDNAYTLSDKMLVPFSGVAARRENNRTYNFYLSQLRIRIEMAFGRLTTKWRIFRRNLDCSLEKNSLIILAAGKLHNFVIENDMLNFSEEDLGETDIAVFGVERLDEADYNSIGIDSTNRGYCPFIGSVEKEISSDNRRNEIVGELIARDMTRPEHNRRRNRLYDAG